MPVMYCMQAGVGSSGSSVPSPPCRPWSKPVYRQGVMRYVSRMRMMMMIMMVIVMII